MSFFIAGLLSDFSYTGRLPKIEIWLYPAFGAIGIDFELENSSLFHHILTFCPIQVSC
ncbi:hypothetical protein SAG0163_01590 [Streptococcus agalactiae MRI Z1-215]|nr:hypothetical protein SAG0163_01590 [Streptococcus agalactiae MRI Z1-215]